MLRPSPATEPTRIAVAAAGSRARVELSVGLLAPRVVARGPEYAHVAVAAAQMLLLDGDELVIEVDVGAGCTLEVEDVGGTVAYPGTSSWRLVARIGEAGRLVWRGLPFVITSSASSRRATEITLAPRAAVLMRETLVFGRHAERGGRVWSESRIEQDDRPLLLERLEADATRPQPGILGSHRVMDSIVAVGFRPPPAAGMLVLETPGGIVRHLGEDTHGSSLDADWACWRAALVDFTSLTT